MKNRPTTNETRLLLLVLAMVALCIIANAINIATAAPVRVQNERSESQFFTFSTREGEEHAPSDSPKDWLDFSHGRKEEGARDNRKDEGLLEQPNSEGPATPLPEYPRPQLRRKTWTNLNGSWDYAVRPREATSAGAAYDGKILVPFAIESKLSGVARRITEDQRLWYRRTFTAPAINSKQRLLLHFGAIDWQAEVTVNGKHIGTHEGGYDPFTFDITNALKPGRAHQQLSVAVWDPTDKGPQPRGKQVSEPRSIWYTPVTGIWQTVWLETVPDTYIVSTRHIPDIDPSTLTVDTAIANPHDGDTVRVSAWIGKHKVAEQTNDARTVLHITHPHLWSPTDPFLYDLRIAIIRKGRVIDEVESYFALRKISIAPDANGIQRIRLNNQFLFQYGPLDQGWWPDGLYTAPTDEALRTDIERAKAMGFNMIRKHVKVEPARWYTHADRLGILVWQDMPSGDLGNTWDSRPGIIGRATDKQRTRESETTYRTELKALIDALYNFPSIIIWVPFNEAWGQFKTAEITTWTQHYDPTRLVNSASGGNFTDDGDIIDLHNYPDPAMPSPELFGTKRAIVLGEFGGLGLPIEHHLWQQDRNWGYRDLKTSAELQTQYTALLEKLRPLIQQGLSAAVYTQLTDVESEVNGLITYDRQVLKIPPDTLRELHRPLLTPPPPTPP